MAQIKSGDAIFDAATTIHAGKGKAIFQTGQTQETVVNLFELDYPFEVQANQNITVEGAGIVFHGAALAAITPNAFIRANHATPANRLVTITPEAIADNVTLTEGTGTVLLQEFNADGDVTYQNTIRLNNLNFPFQVTGQDSDDTGAGNTVITPIGSTHFYVAR